MGKRKKEETGELKKCPEDRKPTDKGMSNLDHSIEDGFGDDLKEGYRGDYCGWNFTGTVWYESDMFYIEVWVRGGHVETMEAETPAEIMEIVCEKYGYE